MRSYLYAILFASAFALLICVAGLLWIVSAPFDRHLLGIHRLTAFWAFHTTMLQQFWGCDFEDHEAAPRNGTYIYVSNHQSLADILVLYGLRRDFKWVAKDYLFKLPFLGWIMSMNRYVCLPKSVVGIRKAMRQCRNLLNHGVSLFIFPEGTRSPDGNMTEFHQGAFKLSAETGTAIVPVVLDGTHNILPKGSLRFRFGNRIRIKVLDPVYPADFDFNASKLRAHVRSIMVSELSAMRGESVPHLVPDIAAARNIDRKAS